MLKHTMHTCNDGKIFKHGVRLIVLFNYSIGSFIENTFARNNP